MDIGHVIADRYRISEIIGRGGMGRVWLARDLHLNRSVAVKTMDVDASDPEQAERDAKRFAREATTVAGLDHSGLATVYDLGVEDGLHYLVMQHVHGTDLGDYIAETAPLDIVEVAAIGVQICSVLGAAHAKGIVHRDLKPGNVRIRTDGVVKVLDFGVAALLDPKADHLTRTGERPGTLRCMSPEQVEGDVAAVDHRADLYALGCLLYEMLTGRPVFSDEYPLLMPSLHVHETPVPPGQIRDDIPQDIEALVLELLAKAPADRPAHAGAVYPRLARFLPGPADPALALRPWAEVAPLRPFQHPMAPDARPVRLWASQADGD
ncbi:serine/threonine-protein kinase [Yinghuangia sp. YIM S09857]|uniref:serine/threonine-protein kinase n=1 Tax=Yinghuangia sp. YIM S09857 TaxID=3436929 RepID=UPI003F53DD33